MLFIKNAKLRYIYFGGFLTFLGLSFIGLSLHYYFKKVNTEVELMIKLNEAKNKIIYYDEVLTMSSRMGAFSGNKKWEERYLGNVDKLDEKIKLVLKFAPDSLNGDNPKITDQANQALIEDETTAFKLVNNGKLKEAQEVLFSTKYEKNKEIYTRSITSFESELNSLIAKSSKDLRDLEFIIRFTCITILLFLIILWIRIFKKFKHFEEKILSSRISHENKTNELALLGEISSGMAHDIIHPLTVIKMNAKKLDGQESPEVVEKVKENILKSTEHAVKIVHNLSELSRTENKIKKQLFSFDEIMNSALEFSEKRLRMNSVEKIDCIYEKSIKVYCRPTQLKQVLINLLINASDAIASLKEKWIKVDVVQIEDFYYISVKDSGEGISKDQAKRVFDSQFTTKEEGKGTGMGLSLSKKLIIAMKGEIFIDHKQEHTTFIIKLPIQEEKEKKSA